MLRKHGYLLALLPCVLVAQGPAGSQDAAKAKTLDGLAKTPFLTQRSADAVKNVMAGGAKHKAEEKVLDPAAPSAATASPNAVKPALNAPAAGQPANGQPTPAAAPEPKFGWRLIGISVGKRQGIALFESDGKSKSVSRGAQLDSDSKVLSISKTRVTLDFHGKRLELMPW